MDVSAAFHKLSFKAAQKAMAQKKVDKEILEWYQQHLENRISIVEFRGVISEIEMKSGTPQGGILSVILWNMAFDLLLKKLKCKKVKVIGFADDGALIVGKNISCMNRLMQKAVDTANKWAEDNGLALSPEKSVAVLLSRC